MKGGGACLPEDIVLEVLARVPAKDLCRFRCVCKGWYALISDPAFVAAQRSHAGPYIVGVFYGPWWPPKVRVMDIEGNLIRVIESQVLGIDNGTNVLGMLQKATKRLDLMCANIDFFIDPAAGRAWTWTMGTHVTQSFGCTARSATFKVICLENDVPTPICKVAAIMEGGAAPLRWRQTSAPPFHTSCNSKQRATVNGVVYFMRLLYFNEHYTASNSAANCLAAFDLESEEWRIINGPTFGIQAKSWEVTLTVLNGTLAVVHCLRNDIHNYTNIWLLNDFDTSVWVKEYTIQMPISWKLIKLVGPLDDGRILLLASEIENVITKEKQVRYGCRVFLVFYNPSTKTFTKFMDIESENDTLVLYTGSLLS